MPGKIPVEHIHDVHHPDAWFEYWQHNNHFYGHLDMPDQPTDNLAGLETDTDQNQQQNNSWSDFGWSNFDFHG
jgi:hypothetical protein